MNVLDGVLHGLHFVAPAAFVAFLVAWVGLWQGRRVSLRNLLRQTTLLAAANVVVLVLGLVWFGRDGKMATYALMIIVCASCQLVLTVRSGKK
jgi:NADH:ubiquinone oxidoreductase subunit K